MSYPVPTARLAALIALCAVGVLLFPDRGWWTVGAAALLGLVLAAIDTLLSPSPKRIEVERLLPAATTVGHPATVGWTVRSNDRRPVRVTVVDQMWPSFAASRRRISATLPGHGVLEASATITPNRRGRFPVEEIVVRVESVLGLVARQHSRSVPAVLRVFPEFKSKDDVERRVRRAQLLEIGLRSVAGRGSGTEFEQLREYSPDDDPRRLDWAATARSGRPIVRTYRPERNQTIVCLLDNGRLMAGTVRGVARSEHAMDAVMALTAVSAHAGDKLGLVAFDRQVRTIVVPSNGATQMSRVTEAMYRLEPALVESAYASVFMHVASRFRRRSLIVMFTDLVEAAVDEAILPALPVLGRQHLVVIAAVRDPMLSRWAQADHGDAADADSVAAVYREAAAIAALEQRQRTIARLRGAGAVVIDADPGRLAVDLVDSYLSLKAAGRL